LGQINLSKRKTLINRMESHSKSKRLKETERCLKKVTENLKLRLKATEKAMKEAKWISARLTELEKQNVK
jgi:hypothetical protein